MHFLNQVHRTEKIRFTRAGCPAPLIHTADRPLLAQDHRATGQSLPVLRASGAEAGDVGQIISMHRSHPILGV